MAYTIRLLPGGRTFEAERHETLLEAALQHGVRLPYNCSNGTCGECKARIVAGEPDHVAPHDYRLTEAEKAENYTLLCRTYPAGDMTIEAAEAVDTSEIPYQEITARIRKFEPLTEDVVFMELQTPRTRTLRFLAGQYVRLRLPDGEEGDLPVASCPCNGRLLQFHLSRKGEAFERVAIDGLRVGYHADISGPLGEFTLDEEGMHPLVFIAVGTGFAPIKSMVEQAIALDWPEPVRLIRIADDSAGHYLANYCRAWKDALEDYDFVLAGNGRDADVGTALRKAVDRLELPASGQLYIAVPERSRPLVSEWLNAADFPRDRVAVFPEGFGSG